MKKNDSSPSSGNKRLSVISALLILSGTVISVLLVALFIQLFKARTKSITPTVFDVNQIGATDSSVLLVWSHSEAANEFIVRYRSTDSLQISELRTNSSFVAIHGLEPYKNYKADVIPVVNGVEYTPVSVICSTDPYCNITEINVDDITNHSAHITWDFKGINEGFTAIAYAVDQKGRRFLTTEKIQVTKDGLNECTFESLLSDVTYTVCVMPNTRYSQVKKITFTTDIYSKTYNTYTINRFVICSVNSTDPFRVSVVRNLTAGQQYKTSLIMSGTADSTKTVNMATYVTDSQNIIVSYNAANDVFLNPDGKNNYFYRSYEIEFTAPLTPGEYYLYAVVDGTTIKKLTFEVI